MPSSSNDRFKKAARERQARTGESYSIARMRVMNATPTALLDPSWRDKIGKFVVLPHRQTADDWATTALGTPKGPMSTAPLVKSGEPERRSIRVEREAENDEEVLLQRELERAGIHDVQAAWAFLRPKRTDDVDLLRAKAEWRSRGVGEAYRLVNVPADMGIAMYDGRTGQVDPRWRVVRCSTCAKDLGDINVAVTVVDGGSIEPFEAAVTSWQTQHRLRSRPCRVAFAVVGREAGTRP